MPECPECGGALTLTEVQRGEIIPCPDCGVELEVREIDPLQVELAPEIREDWGE